MRVLLLDTALEAAQAGVFAVDPDGGVTALSMRTEAGRGRAEAVVDLAAAVMDEAGVAFADLSRLAVITGPGSFTGVRVALAAARGYGLATGLPVAGVGTLEAFAAEVVGDGAAGKGAEEIAAVVDARHGALFGQRFDAGGAPLEEAGHLTVDALADRLPAGAVLVGAGTGPLAAALAARGRPASQVRERARADLSAAVRLAARGPAPAAPPSPAYLKAPAAAPFRGALARTP